jgi:hypothetical protein
MTAARRGRLRRRDYAFLSGAEERQSGLIDRLVHWWIDLVRFPLAEEKTDRAGTHQQGSRDHQPVR